MLCGPSRNITIHPSRQASQLQVAVHGSRWSYNRWCNFITMDRATLVGESNGCRSTLKPQTVRHAPPPNVWIPKCRTPQWPSELCVFISSSHICSFFSQSQEHSHIHPLKLRLPQSLCSRYSQPLLFQFRHFGHKTHWQLINHHILYLSTIIRNTVL